MAEEQQGQTTEQAATKKSQPASPNVLLLAVLILNTALMGAVAFFQYKLSMDIAAEPSAKEIIGSFVAGSGSAQNADQVEKAVDEDGKVFPMESFTANLAQGDGPRRYIRLEIVLKLSKDSKDSEFEARKPQIRDRILGLLNSKRPEDILQVEGKRYLKEEIKSSINSFLIDGRVIDVYYVGLQIN